MDIHRLDGHKRILGIMYLVSSALSLIGILLLNALLSFIFSFAFDEMNAEEQRVLDFVMSIAAYIPSIVIILFVLPTALAGIGLLMRKSWAMILAVVVGCFKLFSFPIGTAIGIYAIWIFTEDQKLSRTQSN